MAQKGQKSPYVNAQTDQKIKKQAFWFFGQAVRWCRDFLAIFGVLVIYGHKFWLKIALKRFSDLPLKNIIYKRTRRGALMGPRGSLLDGNCFSVFFVLFFAFIFIFFIIFFFFHFFVKNEALLLNFWGQKSQKSFLRFLVSKIE